jgi:hypothetical protein
MLCRGGAGRKCGRDSECGASALHEHRWRALRARMPVSANYKLLPERSVQLLCAASVGPLLLLEVLRSIGPQQLAQAGRHMRRLTR